MTTTTGSGDSTPFSIHLQNTTTMAELKPLRVTTRERLVQQTSVIDTLLDVASFAILNAKDYEAALEHLQNARAILHGIVDDTNTVYWDTIEYPGGENGFPHKGENL